MSNRVRRNGLLSSCEPCRKSKLGCDHVRPQCGRCVRRRLRPEQCHYHPAPMSRAKSPGSSPSTTVNVASRSEVVAAGPLHVSSHAVAMTDNADRATSLIEMNEFSYHTLAEQAQRQLHDRRYASLDQRGVVAPTLLAEADAHIVTRGVKVLETLLSLASDLDEAFTLWSARWDEQVSLGPIQKAAWQTTHAMLSALREAPLSSALHERSRTLTEHSCRRVIFPPSAEDNALGRMFAGDSLRWELVGMYCTRIGLYFAYHDQVIPGMIANGNTERDRKAMLHKSFFACTECASLCDSLGQVNDLTLFHLCSMVNLATWCCGDDSYHVWQQLGDLTSVVYSLKYHKPGVVSEHVPLYLAELRKRALGWVHEHDKEMATFVGRPPRLTRRYCAVEIPLELSNEVIEGSTEALEMAAAMLDENGWDRSSPVMPVTRHRVVMILLQLREEVLELSLGLPLADWISRAQSILSRVTLAWHSIPYASDDMPDWKNQPWSSSMLRLFARLGYLYTKFLLHKLLVGHDLGHRTDLLCVAHEILSLVLSMFKQRIMVVAFRLDMEWTMVFYAMPCASVLLWELLGWTQALAGAEVPSRATLIRDINTLITCCDWLVESGESNYAICRQGQTIFSKGLDIVLNSTNIPQRPPDDLARVEQNPSTGYPAVVRQEATEAFVQDPEWTAWLETLGLQSDLWLDLDTMGADACNPPAVGAS